jgi:hypothetical protein
MKPTVVLPEESSHLQLYDVAFRWGVGAEQTGGALSLLEVTVSAVVVLAIPDPAPRRPGWRSALRPALAVPEPARPMFLASAPSLVGTFGAIDRGLPVPAKLATLALVNRRVVMRTHE